MRRQIMFLVLAAGVAVGASACEDDLTGNGEEQAPAGQSTPAPTPSGDTPVEPAPAGGILASRDVQDDGDDLQIEITGLQRQGQTLSLQWRITVTSVAETGDNWYVGGSMGEGPIDFTVSGVTLVDPVNAQRYLVARSGGEDGECACTQNTNFYMDEGDTADFFANYAAPPPDVTTINVEFPRFGAFTDVPIS
jgi:hypothetical protein